MTTMVNNLQGLLPEQTWYLIPLCRGPCPGEKAQGPIRRHKEMAETIAIARGLPHTPPLAVPKP